MAVLKNVEVGRAQWILKRSPRAQLIAFQCNIFCPANAVSNLAYANSGDGIKMYKIDLILYIS